MLFSAYVTVADPGEARRPPYPVKTSKKMAVAWGRKFRKSSRPLGQISGSATTEQPFHGCSLISGFGRLGRFYL